ncbi:MAG TPA: aminotransferase class V-fold PLP-dependent enzyme [Gemmataceae bacterium]|jgi:dTDP-4-amino-4,6-dideoxygalactose transaminase|nr:aminotransferase class V-fold PLP-dependent enzyme [Gemmataceae bacterium]
MTIDQMIPALLGGSPVRPEGPPDWPAPDADVAAALNAAIANGSWGKYLGANVARLEELLAAFHGVPHALTCASGTLAVEVALKAVGVGPSDEVILAAYDFEPTFLTIHNIGARPVLVDVSPSSAGLDPAALDAAIGPATRAILVSHLHGGIVSMKSVLAIAAARNIPVVEDACQATGAIVECRPAGTSGDIGVLSFGGSKLLTAGRGGALLTANAELHQRMRLLLGRGVQQWAALSELQACVLVAQLRNLPGMNEFRARGVRQLLGQIADIPGLQAIGPPPPDSRPAFYKLGFHFDATAFGLSRDLFIKAMRAEGIAFDAGFRALHVGRAASRYRAAGPLSNAENAGRDVVALHHPVLALEEAAIEQVATAVRKTYRNAARFT